MARTYTNQFNAAMRTAHAALAEAEQAMFRNRTVGSSVEGPALLIRLARLHLGSTIAEAMQHRIPYPTRPGRCTICGLFTSRESLMCGICNPTNIPASYPGGRAPFVPVFRMTENIYGKAVEYAEPELLTAP